MNQTSIVKMIEKYRKLEFIEPEYSVSSYYVSWLLFVHIYKMLSIRNEENRIIID